MEIYVQSSGYSPDFGYCWMRKSPPYLSKVSSYIQNDSSSLVLARFDGNLFLLVTDLSSPEKKDFRDRPIRHSVAWECEDNDENEKMLRAIAIEALRDRDDLTRQVDQLIQLNGTQGFTFEKPQFEGLSKSILDSFKPESSDNVPDKTIKIAKNSQELKILLAEELQKSDLPSGYELLVVVTGIKSEDTLKKAHIWRSLSSLVKSESVSWKTVSNEKEDLSPKKLVTVIALVLLLVAVAIILWILLVH
jgi:hypothetical protein